MMQGRLGAASSLQPLGRARYYVLWLGTLAGGEIVTARPQPSCGGRLIAARVTRPSSAPAAAPPSCLRPESPHHAQGKDQQSQEFGCYLALRVAHRQEPGSPKSSACYTSPEHLQQMNNSWNCFYSGLKECAQQRTYFLGSHPFHTRGFVYRANPVGRTGDQSSA